MFFGGAPMDEEKKKKLDEAFSILDQFLEKTKCVAGDEYTLADIAIAVSVSTAEVCLSIPIFDIYLVISNLVLSTFTLFKK